MIAAQRKNIMAKILFKNKDVQERFKNCCSQIDGIAEDVLITSLYQNGHKVINCRNGETKVGGRREVVYIEAVDLNDRPITYRVDVFGNGSNCDYIREEIRKGWQPVSVW